MPDTRNRPIRTGFPGEPYPEKALIRPGVRFYLGIAAEASGGMPPKKPHSPNASFISSICSGVIPVGSKPMARAVR